MQLPGGLGGVVILIVVVVGRCVVLGQTIILKGIPPVPYIVLALHKEAASVDSTEIIVIYIKFIYLRFY